MATSRVQKAIHYQFHNSRSINCNSYLYGWLIGPFMDFTKPENQWNTNAKVDYEFVAHTW